MSRQSIITKYLKETDYSNLRIAKELRKLPEFEQDSIDVLRHYVSNIRKDLQEQEVRKGLEIPEASIPESIYVEPPIVELTGKIAVIGDLHIPFHDKRALETVINYIIKWQPDILYLNGDIGDFYGTSKFERNPYFINDKREIDALRQFLEFVNSKFSKVIYYEGNHEMRWARHLWNKDPEKAKFPEFTLPAILHLKESGIDWIENGTLVKAGKLNIIHGNEIHAGGLVNVARTKLIRAFDNVLFGHHHFKDERTERTLGGGLIGGWSVGCLCGLRPEYYKVNNWVHGFATVEVFNDGNFHVENLQLINYKII